jgi:hypothetical protein
MFRSARALPAVTSCHQSFGYARITADGRMACVQLSARGDWALTCVCIDTAGEITADHLPRDRAAELAAAWLLGGWLCIAVPS